MSPFPPHQVSVPAQQGAGLNEEATTLRTGDQPPETGQNRPVRWPQCRTRHLASQHRHLVAEHDDLNGQISAVRPLGTKELQDANEGKIQKREGHGPLSWSRPSRRKSLAAAVDGIFGTHRLVAVCGHPRGSTETRVIQLTKFDESSGWAIRTTAVRMFVRIGR